MSADTAAMQSTTQASPAEPTTTQPHRESPEGETAYRHNQTCNVGLPSHLYIECCRRLRSGDSAVAVASWVIAQPNRGAFQHIDKSGLQRYFHALARLVNLGLTPEKTTSTQVSDTITSENQKQVEDIRTQCIAGTSEPLKNDMPTPEKVLSGWAEDLNPETAFRALFKELWVALQRLDAEEAAVREKLGPGVLVSHLFVDERVKLIKAMIEVLAGLRRFAELEWRKQTSGFPGKGVAPAGAAQ